MTKNEIIAAVVQREGGYVDDAADAGGETNYGITHTTARQHGYEGAMVDMPLSVAVLIYGSTYWSAVDGDRLLQLSPRLAAKLFDMAVNLGPRRAVQILQRALNALHGSQLVTDGVLGAVTRTALHEYHRRRGDAALLTTLSCLQGAYYVQLTEHRPQNRRFLHGWLLKRVKL